MLLALHPHKPLGKALPPKTSVGRQEKWGSLDQKFLAEEGSQAGGWELGQTQKTPYIHPGVWEAGQIPAWCCPL